MKVRAVGGRVLVIPMDGETDEQGRAMKGGLYLGREEKHPVGIVASVGSEAPEGVTEGSRVLWARDLGAEFEYQGVQFNSLHTLTRCPHCQGRIRDDAVMAVLEE